MTIANDILTAKRAQPFRPFTMYLNDGRRLTVSRADSFILGCRGRLLAVNTRSERLRLINVDFITKVTIRSKSRRRKGT